MTSISPICLRVLPLAPGGDTELDIAPIQRLSQHYQLTCYLSNSFLRCVRSTLLIAKRRSTSASICSTAAIRPAGEEGHASEAPSVCAGDRDRDSGEPCPCPELSRFRIDRRR